MTPGYIFKALDIRNPFGLVLRHKIEELSIPRKNLAADIGYPNTPNYISMMTSPDGRPASFSTKTGPILVDAILDAELRHDFFLTPAERKNFARRRKQVLHAMTLLSMYHSKPRQADDPCALFSLIVDMAGHMTYRVAMNLVGDAILATPRNPSLNKPGAATRELRHFQMRRAAAEAMADIDLHPQREEIFEVRGKKFVEAGDRAGALRAMTEGLEGLMAA